MATISRHGAADAETLALNETKYVPAGDVVPVIEVIVPVDTVMSNETPVN
jgi:hypothetical protein